MKLNDAYPSQHLTAEDLDGKDVAVTITNVELVELGQGPKKEQKLCIAMKGKKKQFICNKTNAKTIAKILNTEETDEWIGRSIIIGPREVEFQGDMVLSIRVSLKLPVSAKPVPAAKPEPSDDDLADEDIPFN